MKIYSQLIMYFMCIVLLFTPISSTAISADTVSVKKPRLYLVAGTHLAINSTTLYLLNDIWYKKYDHSKFHFKNDNRAWCQIDKLGHSYSAYAMTGILSNAYRWTGLTNKQSTIIGALGSFGNLTIIELLDAHSAQWGFSTGDMLANTFGVSLYAIQELVFDEQIMQMKFSYYPKKYPEAFKDKVREVYGDNLPEMLLKDYNAQTYWLSFNPRPVLKKWPRWLNVAIGYGADNMYGALDYTWLDADGNAQNRTNLPRYRQWYLSLDINLANIETKSSLLNSICDVLVIKFPSPTLEYNRQQKLIFHLLFF